MSIPVNKSGPKSGLDLLLKHSELTQRLNEAKYELHENEQELIEFCVENRMFHCLTVKIGLLRMNLIRQ